MVFPLITCNFGRSVSTATVVFWFIPAPCCSWEGKKIYIPNSILLLLEDIWKLSQDLNIHIYRHIYREANRIADCQTKKVLGIVDSNV